MTTPGVVPHPETAQEPRGLGIGSERGIGVPPEEAYVSVRQTPCCGQPLGGLARFVQDAPRGRLGPKSIGGPSFTPHLHVDDADAVIGRAGAAGAEIVREPEDKFYGERSGTLRDPFGHEWNVGHEIEKVDPPEMQRRYDERMRA